MRTLHTWKQELTDELTHNILPFWMNRMPDSTNGGFCGQITGNNDLVLDAPKGAIMHERILWTFAAAYRTLGRSEYLETATQAKRYIIDHFYDHKYGGIYWSLTSDGQPLDTKKQFYALGFAIYGLSEYARATGDKEALDYAIRLFESIEEHSFDPIDNGYFEAQTRDWQQIGDMRLSDKDANEKKTMNTHLHILEPYTNLYRIWKSELLRDKIINLLNLFLDKIESQKTHHLGLFFDEKWNEKSVGQYSYGHDIEASWLLLEAAHEVGDPVLLNKTMTHCNNIAMAAMEGYQPDGSLIYEHHIDGSLNRERHWWVQAEMVIGLFYLYKFHEYEAALTKAQHTWDYIKTNIVDHKDGEWFWSVLDDGTQNKQDDKAGFWKCPYHNSRMCMEIISLIK